MTPTQIKTRDNARLIEHEFYVFALFGHAMYSIFFLSEFSASFWILISGTIIYSLSEFFFNNRAAEEELDKEI